jgi:ABC-2 type transport system permease protein
MMSDLFVKYIADIMPTRFYRTFLTKGHAVDNFSLFLFLAYLIIFTLLSWKIFSKKEILR